MGVRLLRLARRTGELPELALGLCLVMIATFAYPLSIVSLLLQESGAGVRTLIYVATQATVDAGIIAVAVFTARVFRPASRTARAALVVGTLGLLAILVSNSWTVATSLDADTSTALTRDRTVAFFLISTAAFSWTAFEAGAWWLRMRRRAALGLADPVVANRFGLWTAWGVATALGAVINAVGVASGASIHAPAPLLATALLGFVNTGALFLAFFAPSSYVERIARKAAASR